MHPMPPPRPHRIRQLLLLLLGLVVFLVIVRISNSWDTTRDIEYLQPPQPVEHTPQQLRRTVYICDNRNARLYHFYTDCDELAKCTDKVLDLPLGVAEEMGREACTTCKD